MLTAMLVTVALAQSAQSAQVTVAVAANFTDAAKEIGALFELETGHEAVFSFGSTGQFFAQISQGAPFDVFLAADQARPALTIEEGFASPESRFTYAIGKIVLYSADPNLVHGQATLSRNDFSRIAIANPRTAPYGVAAIETMEALGVDSLLRPKIVQGNNISQTYQFVATGNAELGFVALAQVVSREEGSRWLVPQHLYSPIAQDAVLLRHGESNEAAEAFMEFLKGPAARAVIEGFGYGAAD